MNLLGLAIAAFALFALAQTNKQPGTAPAKPELPSPFPDKPKPPSDDPYTPGGPQGSLLEFVREPTQAEMQAALMAKDLVWYDLGDETIGGTYYALFLRASPLQNTGGTFRLADLAVAIEQGFYIVARDAHDPRLKPQAGYPWKYYAIEAVQPMQLLVEDTGGPPRWAVACSAKEAPRPKKWVRVTMTGSRRVRDALGVA